ncbi:winged helix-turn-helix domain-containing protein [Planctomycetota bacterium]|nr:winged helix-turn-helix domain-containing protein [Planctomycetota bacterium]
MTPKDLNAGPDPRGERTGASSGHRWTFLSNHAHVLITLAQDPAILIREIAGRTGITERAVTNILSDLEQEGLVERHREGRRNTYQVHLDQPLRHPIEQHRTVGELIGLILK